MTDMFRSLDIDKTIDTIDLLAKRINERFPMSGLSGVCDELLGITRNSKQRTDWISRPNYYLRISIILIVAIGIFAMFYSINYMDISIRTIDIAEFVQVSEAAINDLVLIGAAIFFLTTIETRIKRARALDALHELRTIAHVIDMHQLTKDPSRLMRTVILTPSSPKEEMDAYQLMRYLDYCSEMLSLTGKVAAIYAQNFRDAVVLSAVNEVENLTTGLSRKIWQKIMILDKQEEHRTLQPG
jgi:hypothetical protein